MRKRSLKKCVKSQISENSHLYFLAISKIKKILELCPIPLLAYKLARALQPVIPCLFSAHEWLELAAADSVNAYLICLFPVRLALGCVEALYLCG